MVFKWNDYIQFESEWALNMMWNTAFTCHCRLYLLSCCCLQSTPHHYLVLMCHHAHENGSHQRSVPDHLLWNSTGLKKKLNTKHWIYIANNVSNEIKVIPNWWWLPVFKCKSKNNIAVAVIIIIHSFIYLFNLLCRPAIHSSFPAASAAPPASKAAPLTDWLSAAPACAAATFSTV